MKIYFVLFMRNYSNKFRQYLYNIIHNYIFTTFIIYIIFIINDIPIILMQIL